MNQTGVQSVCWSLHACKKRSFTLAFTTGIFGRSEKFQRALCSVKFLPLFEFSVAFQGGLVSAPLTGVPLPFELSVTGKSVL
jgi:hypothetical protein